MRHVESTISNTLLPAKVTNLTGAFVNSDSTVKMTPDGVTFGPYADGGTAAGTLIYSGLNGKTLSSVKNLVYYARYLATDDTGGVGVPYLRIFLNNNTHDAIFSPNTQQPNPDVAQGPFHEWVATSGSWRYDDDGGNGPDESYADLLAAHGSETISGIRVSVGNSAGANLQALLRWMQINGKTYNFGSSVPRGWRARRTTVPRPPVPPRKGHEPARMQDRRPSATANHPAPRVRSSACEYVFLEGACSGRGAAGVRLPLGKSIGKRWG